MCPKASQGVPGCPTISHVVTRYPKVFQGVPGWPRVAQGVPGCTKVPQDVPRCPKVSQVQYVPWCPKVRPAVTGAPTPTHPRSATGSNATKQQQPVTQLRNHALGVRREGGGCETGQLKNRTWRSRPLQAFKTEQKVLRTPSVFLLSIIVC